MLKICSQNNLRILQLTFSHNEYIISFCIIKFQMLYIISILTEQDQNITQQIKSLAKETLNSSQPDVYLEQINKLLELNQSNPQLLYARSYIYEYLKQYNQSIDDLHQSLKSNSPYKMKGILRLKQLCTEICDYHCNKNIEEKYFGGKEGYHKLNQLIEDRDIAIQSLDLQQLVNSSQKCTKDVPLYQVLLTEQLAQSLFSEAQETIEKLKQISNIDGSEITKIQNAIIIIQSLNNFNFSSEVVQQIQNMQTINQQLKDQLVQFYQNLSIANDLANIYTPISNKPQMLNEKISIATQQLKDADIKQLVIQLQLYCQQEIKQLKNIDLTHIINDFYQWKEMMLQYLKVYNINRPYNAENVNIDQIKYDLVNINNPNLLAIKGITIVLNLYPQIQQLQQQYQETGLIDFELDALENKYEQARKLLNKALFNVKQYQQSNIKQLLDDCNQVMGNVLQLRINSMNLDCYKLLNISQNASQSEMKKAYFKASRKLHPDQYPADITQDEKKRRQRMFQKIAEAYEILSNDQKRIKWQQGQYNLEDVNQLVNLYQTRVQASYTVPPDYEGSNEGLSDEELKKYMNDEQWYEYQKQRRRQQQN